MLQSIYNFQQNKNLNQEIKELKENVGNLVRVY